MLSVITHPNYISNSIEDGFINADIVTSRVFAYSDASLTPQDLTLGATADVKIEAVDDVNIYMGTDNTYRLFTTSVTNGVRTDTEAMSVSVVPPSASNDLATTLVETPAHLSFQPAALSNSVISLGNFSVSQTGGTALQVLDTEQDAFRLTKGVQVAGGLTVANDLITGGSVFGRDMNIWADKVTSGGASSSSNNRIGFGMRINDRDELEIVKYARFDNNAEVLRKVAVFGAGTLGASSSSDSASNYLVFNSLGQVSVANGNGALSPISSSSSSSGTFSGSASNVNLRGTTTLLGNLVPASNAVYSLGSNAAFLAGVYTNDLIFPSGTPLTVNGAALLSTSLTSSSTSNAATSSALSNVNATASQALSVANAALPAAGGTVSGNLSVGGNLTILGTTTSVNTTSMTVNDNIVTLNNNQTGTPPSILRSGIEVERGDLPNYFFLFEESTQLFKVGLSNSLQAVCTRDDTLPSGYLYFDSNLQKCTQRTLGVSDVSGLVSSQWTSASAGANVYFGTNFGNSSNVGIGFSNPSYKLAVNGEIFAADEITAFSDARFKENVTTLTSALDKVSAMRGCTYTRRDRDHSKTYVGLIAQEVQQVLPEVVSTDQDGHLSLAYGNIVAVLIEAIKELKLDFEHLKADLSAPVQA